MKNIKAELSIILSSLLFAITSVLIKLISGTFSSFFISFFRFFTGLVIGIFIIFFYKMNFKTLYKKDVFLRGLFGVLSVALYYYSIKISGSSKATLLNSMNPVFIAIFSYLFFKEKINIFQIAGIILCVAGVYFVFSDNTLLELKGDIIGLGSAVAGALALIYTKKAREYENSFTIYFYFCLFGVLLMGFSIPETKLIVSFFDFFILALTGIVVYFAQVFLTYGMKYMSSTNAGVLVFTRIIFTGIFGFFILKERFSLTMIAGALLIVFGIVLSRKSSRLSFKAGF